MSSSCATRSHLLLSVRVKFVIVGVLLLLASGVTIFAAVATIQAFQGLQQQSALVHSGDVRTISDWMTIPYIARTYHVPENYLYQWLHITGVQKPRHVTLRLLAARYHWTVSDLVRSVQAAIRAYRAHYPPLQNTPGSSAGARHLAGTPGRIPL
jgi:hypothetical protein